MNVKNLNPFERHVEKIVLAVAVAGALYIGYLATQPITVPDTQVTASDVEPTVTKAVDRLLAVRAEVSKRPESDISPRLRNYVDDYNNIMSRQPLKPELTAPTAVPVFAPIQMAASGTIDTSGPTDMKVVTPTVPLPKNLSATSNRATVAIVGPIDPAAPQPAPGTLPPGTPTKDLNWVTICGRIPMADFIAEMNDPSLAANEKLATAVQRAVVYRIEVQRRTRTAGSWSAWQDVAPSKASGDPINIDWKPLNDSDVVSNVAGLDGAFKKIAEPDFYPQANGQLIIPPILATKPDAGAPKVPGAPAAPTPPPPAPTPPAAASRDPANIDTPDSGMATPAPAPVVPGMPDIAALRQQPNIPFWFYDENVQPNQEYQYQVRIVMFNPTYRFPSGLKDPKMKDEPTIASNWLAVPGTTTVNADLYFFVDNNIGNNNVDSANTKVGFRIFKWTNGNWYSTEGTAQPGMPVTGIVRLFDKGNANLDVPTGYTLVDVLPANNGSELAAVLLSPTGELITRSSKADGARVNVKREELEKQAIKPAQPAPPPKRVIPVPPRPTPGGSRDNPTNIDGP